MFRTDQTTAVTALPVPAAAGTPGYFTGGNPATGQAATILDADWLNMVQEELFSFLSAAGIAPSKTSYNQVLEAAQQLFASSNPAAFKALVEGCIAAVAADAGFSASIGSPGYIKFPSWLGSWIVQWGSTGLTNSSGLSAVSFPIAFPNANLGLLVSPAMGGTSSLAIVGFSNQTVSGFNFWAATPSSSPFTNAGGNYIAVGK
ncbi:gp53-like domain-containing protein [Burkholderia cepacia]|uniref:gp53-like domain-containing protein n=1 Tax=Burkholderia cepacia TaxID=292 RepID=UPI00158961DD|nr:hypothetical protein [Burkholderia cepacia]